jgi:hypothetical protein
MSFILNGSTFKTPNFISTPPFEVQKSEIRSADNTLTVDILTGKKGIKKLTWTVLTTAELATLEALLDTGSYRVQCTKTGYEFDYNPAFITRSEYKEIYSGLHEGISVTVREV